MTERNFEEKFQKNFLTSVACEIRFDPLLIIQNKIPEFQEKIRGKLPSYGFESTIPIVDPSLTSQFDGVKQWIFKSKDKIKTFKILINRIVFIVSKYSKFEDFYEELLKYFNDFFTICNIDEFSRIGLRYVNEFILSELEESKEVSLTKFFNVVLDKTILEEYKPFEFETLIRWKKEKCTLFLKNALSHDVRGESNYIIDIDAFKSGNLQKKDMGEIIKELHKLEIQEFHNHITDEIINILRKD